MKKILILFLFLISFVGAQDFKKIPKTPKNIKENTWIEMKFSFFKRTKVYLVELDENYQYKIIFSDETNKRYGTPKASLKTGLYNEQMEQIDINHIGNAKKIYLVIKAERNKGNAYIYVEKRTKGQNKEGIYEKIKEPKLPEIKELSPDIQKQ